MRPIGYIIAGGLAVAIALAAGSVFAVGFDDSIPYSYFTAGGVSSGGITINGAATDITTGTNEDLTIDANGTGDTIVSDFFKVCSGSCPSFATVSGAGEVGIEGDLEVDGTLNVGGVSTFGEISLFTDGYGRIDVRANDGVYMALGESLANYNFVITTFGNRNKSHDLPTSTNPSLVIPSALNPDTNNTRYGISYHTGTAGDGGSWLFKTASGPIEFEPAAAAVIIPQSIAASPSAPLTCRTETEGALIYVRDTDANPGYVCMCSHTGAAFDWLRVDDPSTACPAF